MSVNHTHICTACNTNQNKGDGFCDECGTQLVPIRYCDDCGVMAPHAGKFCRECGAKLPAIPTSSAPHSPSPELGEAGGDRAAKGAQPAWLSEPDPPRQPAPKPKPVSKPRPIAKTAKAVPAASPPTPLAVRPTADPVPIRSAPLAPPSGPVSTTTALIASTTGVLAVGALVVGNIYLAFMLFVVMMIMGGYRLRHLAADGVDRVIDWVWEDPVLRKRFLGE